MKILHSVIPTAEQLPIISNPRAGVTLIRYFWARRFHRADVTEKPRVLVLTFNRTLRGYIEELAESQVSGSDRVDLSVSTFGKWSKTLTGYPSILEAKDTESILRAFGCRLPLPPDFIVEESDYCMGRFLPQDLPSYVTVKREGRGVAPRMEASLRQRILDEVINPYRKWKDDNNRIDWNDLALGLLGSPPTQTYHVIIADEAQDFSANQLRAIHQHAETPSSIIFVLDAAQRIYPRGCRWTEANITIGRSFRLKENHRNTRQICQFASPLLEGLDVGDDGTLPDLASCMRNGPLPVFLEGDFSGQTDYALQYIARRVDLAQESVAFLHPKGGGWFSYLKRQLDNKGFEYVDITRRQEWPTGPTNIALATMHSAKGLEFDHVFLLGLNAEVMIHGDEAGDTTLETLRRVLAMAITRARVSVTVGTKPGDESDLLAFLEAQTYHRVVV